MPSPAATTTSLLPDERNSALLISQRRRPPCTLPSSSSSPGGRSLPGDLPRRPPSSSVEGDAGLAYPLLQAADRLLVHLHQLLVNVLLDGLHLWDVVHHHVLHPVLERDGGAGAAAAGPGQLHPHRSRGLVELVEEDVPPVLLHGRADALLEQLLDHHHHL
eukprot:CAMPEP_0194585018 /NCGR_PEP_ID=MMETSP0292-20121207/17459_1 /TAXON_ID=39354 /ORGANISM="Heterosigma akashiwo, Strain CCMP2393" /LENGTH=160 /DNA_ID=CAMNT_0039440299 /DNA_START=214 /DNA_END=696 /DNA_ORIENTATION=+